MLVGYARVSSNEQNLDLQVDALETSGCAKIFSDKLSGAQQKRPGLENALSHLRTGDTLVLWKLDRLALPFTHKYALTVIRNPKA